ncbi:fumarylacetoacetate hydrolase family protein [Ramlibacter sp. PS3R-8]|uniref:fumarylacetoacetate hydrolase family protein n=1 Tax=Ramlibacter sp. PS3R-8 TaxID=3133437 RepID=UPI0030B5652C
MTNSVQAVAAVLLQARRDHQAADAAGLETLLQSPEDAYAVQEQVGRSADWFSTGVPLHWKSGGPSRSAALTHAGLPPRNVFSSPADARGCPFHHRLIEAEVALRLARDVSPDDAAKLSHEDAATLVDGMTVSIEIVDSRWQQFPETSALLKLADQQSHGALVLGEWRPFAARDWSRQTCVVQIGQGAPASFRGSLSLGDPAWGLPIWLRHVTRQGASVPRGTIVTTGTWCGMLRAQQGDKVKVVFEGVGEAEVQL